MTLASALDAREQRVLVTALVAVARDLVARMPSADACDVVGEALDLAGWAMPGTSDAGREAARLLRAALMADRAAVFACAWHALHFVRTREPPPTVGGVVQWWGAPPAPPVETRIARFAERAAEQQIASERDAAAYRRAWGAVDGIAGRRQL